MMLPRLTAIWIILCVALSGQVMALEPGEMLNDPALEARARALSAEMRCLVCQNQSIDESEAPLAKDLRVLIRERLVAGDSDPEIVDFVVSRYGEFVLLRPRFSTGTALLWLGPFLILAVATLFILRRRWRPAQSGAEQSLSDEERARLGASSPDA
jgi:cytochrome c-type biogenesis protein CcmH